MYKFACVFASLVVAGALSGACSDDETHVAVGGSGGAGNSSQGGDEGGGGDGGSAGGPQCLAFGETCATGDACCEALGTPGECYPYGMGPRCSIPCPPNPGDCPNGGRGCNTESPPFCKPPQ
jgi:hypothetical protein